MGKTLAMVLIGLVVAGYARAGEAGAPVAQPAKELKLDLGDGVSLKLVLIPAGKFLMGSPETEKGREKKEVQHG